MACLLIHVLLLAIQYDIRFGPERIFSRRCEFEPRALLVCVMPTYGCDDCLIHLDVGSIAHAAYLFAWAIGFFEWRL